MNSPHDIQITMICKCFSEPRPYIRADPFLRATFQQINGLSPTSQLSPSGGAGNSLTGGA